MACQDLQFSFLLLIWFLPFIPTPWQRNKSLRDVSFTDGICLVLVCQEKRKISRVSASTDIAHVQIQMAKKAKGSYFNQVAPRILEWVPVFWVCSSHLYPSSRTLVCLELVRRVTFINIWSYVLGQFRSFMKILANCLLELCTVLHCLFIWSVAPVASVLHWSQLNSKSA